MSRLMVLSALSVVTLLACASPTPRREAPVPATLRDPDQLAASALKAWKIDGNREQALAWIARASELAAQLPELTWLHMRLCAEVRGCEPEPIEARFRELDPESGAVWLGALARAQSSRDARAEQQILEAMSRARHFDLHWTRLVWRLTEALRNTLDESNEPLTTSLDQATTWLSEIAVPAFKPLTAACTAQNGRDGARSARCERIAQAMQRSDTTLVEAVGLGIAQRLAAPGSADASQLEARVATLTYQSQAAGSVVRSQLEREKFSLQMLELMKKLRREQDVSIAILRWAGQSLTPEPAGP